MKLAKSGFEFLVVYPDEAQHILVASSLSEAMEMVRREVSDRIGAWNDDFMPDASEGGYGMLWALDGTYYVIPITAGTSLVPAGIVLAPPEVPPYGLLLRYYFNQFVVLDEEQQPDGFILATPVGGDMYQVPLPGGGMFTTHLLALLRQSTVLNYQNCPLMLVPVGRNMDSLIQRVEERVRNERQADKRRDVWFETTERARARDAAAGMQ